MTDKYYGPGWDPLISPLLALAERWNVKINDVMTNYGGLRISWQPPDVGYDLEPGQLEQFRTAALAVETLSTLICDQCGQPGRLRDTSPAQTRCDKHAEGPTL